MQPVEDQIVVKLQHTRVPYFNAQIYLENKQEIGKVDDIFGPISESVRCTAFKKASAETVTFKGGGRRMQTDRHMSKECNGDMGSRAGGGSRWQNTSHERSRDAGGDSSIATERAMERKRWQRGDGKCRIKQAMMVFEIDTVEAARENMQSPRQGGVTTLQHIPCVTITDSDRNAVRDVKAETQTRDTDTDTQSQTARNRE